MASEEYFLQRNIDNEEAMHRNLDDREKVILNAYQEAQDYLNREIHKIYDRYQSKSDLSDDEISRILNTTVSASDLTELQRLSKDMSDKTIQKSVRDYLSGLAVKHRITVLEDLKAKSYIVSKRVADVQLKTQTDFYIDIIHEAYDEAATEAIIGKSEQIIEMTKQQHPKFVSTRTEEKLQIINSNTDEVVKEVTLQPDAKLPEFKELSTRYVNNILESDWKGSNYSKRIWNDTDLLANRLEELFTVKNLTGMSESEMTKILAKDFQTAMYVARRLVRTEANYMANQAKLRSWKEHGVDKYVLIAVLDFRTSDICQVMDGKIFKVSEAETNVNYPPFHPYCRTIPAAYFGKRTLDGRRQAIDHITGKSIDISQRTNYKDWEKILINRHGQRNVEVARKQAKNYTADLNQFRRYKNVLKDEVPKTMDDFQNVKYTDKQAYDELKKRYREMKAS